MQYFGGKQRISKSLSQYLNKQLKPNQPFVDLFCGSCNVITRINDDRLRIANDKHKYLMDMWKALQIGWLPPDEISREDYKYIRENKDSSPFVTGFVGFGCSFAGKWFGGYAYNGKRNYCSTAKRSVLKKIDKLRDVEFYNLNYSEVPFPYDSLVYCDIPYKDTTQYCSKEVGEFNHEEFYQWVRDNCSKYDIYVSEYKKNVPSDFEIVWEMESKQDIRNSNNKQNKTTEVLIQYRANINKEENKMKKIFCVLAKSSAGKDAITSIVSEDLGIPMATSFTTRPMREGEVEGREYHFIDKETFKQLHRKNKLAEYTSYQVADSSKWYYGLTREELEKSEYTMVIVNPHGLEQLQKLYGDRVVSILVECNGMTRLKRSIKRDKKGNPKELCRRFLADEEDFKYVTCDYLVYNEESLFEAVKRFKKIILEEMGE